MKNHTWGALSLARTVDSFALWAERPTAKTAVVFVHGFGGSAQATWSEFDTLAPADPAFANVDLIFYGYDGKGPHVTESSRWLFDFLDLLSSHAATLANAGLVAEAHRDPGFSYERIVLVGHSLGAVVARNALVLATKYWPRAWAQRCELVLFAPAHLGSRTSEWATAVLSGIPVIPALAQMFFKVPADLAVGSQVLANLRSDVDSLVPEHPWLGARLVVEAEPDHVVMNGAYPGDPYPEPLSPSTNGFRNHIRVCKPSPAFPRPFEILRGVIG
jgi:pimeloyl-ACP methyl ester carboxylesterase